MARQETQGVDGYILEFERDGVAGCGKGGEARFVVPCRLGVMRGDVRGDAFEVGGVDMRPVTELRRRDGEPAAELAAAQDADGRSGSQPGGHPRSEVSAVGDEDV